MRFHDLRHGFATELLRRGVDVHRVQRLMRHSDVRVTTRIYGHLMVEDLRAAVENEHAVQALTPAPKTQIPTLRTQSLLPFCCNRRETAIRRTRIQPLKLLKFLGKMLHGRGRFRTCDPCRVKVSLRDFQIVPKLHKLVQARRNQRNQQASRRQLRTDFHRDLGPYRVHGPFVSWKVALTIS